MTLSDYLKVLRHQWYVVLLLAALSLAGAAAYTFTVTPTYSASTRLFVSFTGGSSQISALQSGSTVAQQRMKTYAALVTSPDLLNEVIGQLQLPYTAATLAGEVTADSPLDTVLLNITATDPDPQRAADIANAVAAAYPAYISGLETPDSQPAAKPLVTLTVTRTAQPAQSPESPRIPLNLALGLLVGLGLGVGAAVLREQLNTSITSGADIEQITGSTPLGLVPFDRGTKQQPLVRAADRGGRPEAFRTLRTNLQFADVDRPPRVVVVTSALPDEGKSTTACNLALTLALNGGSVVLVEADLRKPSLGRYLGVSGAAGLTNVLAKQNELRDVLVSLEGVNFAVLPSGPRPPNPSELLGSSHMSSLLATLSSRFDHVVIDAPPLLPVTDAAVLAAMADGAVLVVRHGSTTRENLGRAVQSLAAVNARLLGTILNFAPVKRGEGPGHYGYADSPKRAGRARLDVDRAGTKYATESERLVTLD